MMKRGWKKSVNKLARDMVCNVMNEELLDIIKSGRELNEERISWLATFGANTAYNTYTTNEDNKTGAGYFMNMAVHSAELYANVLRREYIKEATNGN